MVSIERKYHGPLRSNTRKEGAVTPAETEVQGDVSGADLLVLKLPPASLASISTPEQRPLTGKVWAGDLSTKDEFICPGGGRTCWGLDRGERQRLQAPPGTSPREQVQNTTVCVLGKEKPFLPLLVQRDLLCKGDRSEAERVLTSVFFPQEMGRWV